MEENKLMKGRIERLEREVENLKKTIQRMDMKDENIESRIEATKLNLNARIVEMEEELDKAREKRKYERKEWTYRLNEMEEKIEKKGRKEKEETEELIGKKERAIGEIDRKKTVVIKKGRNWKGEEIEEWITKYIGTEAIKEISGMKFNKEHKWVVLEEEIDCEYLWKKKGKIWKDGAFIIDKVLDGRERFIRWKEEREREIEGTESTKAEEKETRGAEEE